MTETVVIGTRGISRGSTLFDQRIIAGPLVVCNCSAQELPFIRYRDQASTLPDSLSAVILITPFLSSRKTVHAAYRLEWIRNPAKTFRQPNVN